DSLPSNAQQYDLDALDSTETEDIPTLCVDTELVETTELVADNLPLTLAENDGAEQSKPLTDELTLDTDIELGPVADSSFAGQIVTELDEIPEVELTQAIVTTTEATSPAPMSLEDVMSASVAAINPPATEVPPSILPPPADEEPVDEELQEVFVEEVEEVLETLNEFYPQWRDDQDNKAALTEVRRAFHTLKGSGRMVRALVAGELAWSIEDMLNRVIEGNLPVGETMLELIAEVIELFPELAAE